MFEDSDEHHDHGDEGSKTEHPKFKKKEIRENLE